MRFLTPPYLFGAALIALPIVLHLLRRDVAPPVPFTAVSLLRKSPVDRSGRAPPGGRVPRGPPAARGPGRSIAAASPAGPDPAGRADRRVAAAGGVVRAAVPRGG